MTDWRAEAARAVEAELRHTKRADEWIMLGHLRRTHDGAHVVDLRNCHVDPIDDIRIAGANGPRQGAAVPVGGHVAGGVLWLRDAGPLPPECDRVWVRHLSRHTVLSQLARALRDIRDAPLADKLAAGELDPVADDPYSVFTTPGVRLVWGPPATGKSRLIADAVAGLLRAGKRVLLVTATERPVESIAATERLGISEDLAALTVADRRLAELDDILAGYDHDAFLAAQRRIDSETRSATLEAELADVRQRHTDASAELAHAQEALRRTRQAWERATTAHGDGTEIDTLTERLELLNDRCADLRRRLTAKRFYRGRLRDRTDLRAAETERRLLADRVAQSRRRLREADDEGVLRAEAELAAAQARLAAAARVEADTHARIELLRARLAQLNRTPPASDDDRRFHAECRRHDLPTLHAERELLRVRSRHRAALRGRFEERLWWLGERAYQHRREVEAQAWESGQLVRTTLSRHLLTSRPFDVVVVDDAGSARLADVLLAVAQARDTAVVFGDFCQPPPQVHPRELRSAPDVRRWTLATPFGHCGIRQPDDAREHPGCLVLTRQFRFGPTVHALANRLVYQVLERGNRRATEVVLLDTAGEPVERAALARLLAESGGAVFVSSDSDVPGWLGVLRDTLGVAVGTSRTVPDHEFGTVVVDLTDDDWSTRRRAFASAVTRARDRLFLLADLEAVEAAAAGTPLGVVNELRRSGAIPVRKLGELLIPRQRRHSAIGRHVTVIDGDNPDGTMSG